SEKAAPLVQTFWPSTTQSWPSRTARVRSDATSLPASGSLMPMHHIDSPATMSGIHRWRCSGVPNCNNVGPICRSANQLAATEAPSTVVLVAVDDGGRLLGGVTYVEDEGSPLHEIGGEGAASIRMLAVDSSLRRSGAGEALVRECIVRARGAGRRAIVLHSTPW